MSDKGIHYGVIKVSFICHDSHQVIIVNKNLENKR